MRWCGGQGREMGGLRGPFGDRPVDLEQDAWLDHGGGVLRELSW
jgi:hypothetical protein